MICALCRTELFEVDSFLQFFGLVKTEGKELCYSCQSGFEIIGSDCCPDCGRQQVDRQKCYDCQRWQYQQKPSLHHRALYKYNDAMRSFMQQYKFTGDYMLRKIFNRQLIQLVHNTNMDLVVPIPVSQYTMRTRGFNQVTGMLEGIQLTNALQVISVKKRQQSNLNRNDRMKRKQLFDIQDSTLIIGKSILLVDDVYTTGSTLHCAAELLISCGAVSVKSVSLAR